MAVVMKKRERVERALACQETDRVPLYDLVRCDAAFAHFSGEELPPLSAEPDTVRSLERIAGKAVGNFLDMTRNVGFGPVVETEATDRFGFVHHSAPHEKTSWITKRPFDDEKSAGEFVKVWSKEFREQAATIRRDPASHRDTYHQSFLKTQALIGDTVNLLAVHGTGLDAIRYHLDWDMFAYVYADDPGLISEFLDAATERNIAECHAVADLTLSPAVLTYGDIAYKGRLLHSPQYLRDEFFPRLTRLNDAWHEHGFKCLFHSDGYLMEVMDDLLDAGIDGLNPIETVAGMSVKETREKCGPGIFLAGGIDMSQLLSNGTPDEVREVCRQAIRDAAPGYFMGSTTESDNSCKLENLIAMHEVALEGI
ncbi:hypothetical protein HQ520_01095 [bacterium]|nr:hypothetical protein [bacterium]